VKRKQFLGVLSAALTTVIVFGFSSSAAQAADYVPVNGAGSSWSANAIDQWRRNVVQYGMRVNYASTGSSDGRNQFKAGTVDFASSEIPYGLKDGSVVDTLPSRSFAYIPLVAGGTALMYNLKIGGKRFTNLKMSGETLTKVFTGVITFWDDAAIAAENPGVSLPKRKIVPVVRSDGSGSTAQFTSWMADEHTKIWDDYCKLAGRSIPCGLTSNYPIVSGKGYVSQPGSQGVSGYVSQNANEGTITYVEYSYALKTGFPVIKLLNDSDHYVLPTASNVAVALLEAKIDKRPGNSYLTQILTGVYDSKDPRSYPLSSYSYLIVPTGVSGSFTAAKGKTLGDFAYYYLCEGQQQAEVLGYSPLPINLVKAGLEQVKKIPGVSAKDKDVAKCNNPTFSPDGTNLLAKNAPMPPAADKLGYTGTDTGAGGGTDSGNTGGGTDNGNTGGGTDSGNTGGGTDTGGGTTGGGTTGGGWVDNGGVVDNGIVGPGFCDNDTGICQAVSAEAISPPDVAGRTFAQVQIIVLAVLFLALLLTFPVLSLIRRGKNT
jgi:phosphate ABC transporter phosphate-binding protein